MTALLGDRLRLRRRRFWVGPLLIWLAVMIATPIADWATRGQAYPLIATIGVLVQFGVVAAIVAGPGRLSGVWRAAAVVAALTLAVEAIGVRTGFPFGAYHYTAALPGQLGGVPLVIPLAWLMMLPPAWAVTSAIVAPRHRLRFALLAGVVFTAWDLYLDPQMVARGLWIWETPGGYFGIPWTNFAGWWATAALATYLAAPRVLTSGLRRPLAVVYTLTWLLQAVGLGAFWGQAGPALIGFIGMGVWAIWFWLRELRA